MNLDRRMWKTHHHSEGHRVAEFAPLSSCQGEHLGLFSIGLVTTCTVSTSSLAELLLQLVLLVCSLCAGVEVFLFVADLLLRSRAGVKTGFFGTDFLVIVISCSCWHVRGAAWLWISQFVRLSSATVPGDKNSLRNCRFIVGY